MDIRIIAATNRDLEAMVKQGEFRERTVDIPALIQHFINLKTKELKLASIPSITPGAIESAMNYRWPGNVRELQNVTERALILNPQGPVTFEHLSASTPHAKSMAELSPDDPNNLDVLTTRHISRVLEVAKGKINGPIGAAALLGVNPSTLRNRMKKLGIQYGRVRGWAKSSKKNP